MAEPTLDSEDWMPPEAHPYCNIQKSRFGYRVTLHVSIWEYEPHWWRRTMKGAEKLARKLVERELRDIARQHEVVKRIYE